MSSRPSINAETYTDLGFSACGVVRLRPVDDATADRYRRWLEQGCNADMAYLANHEDKRLDPRLLMPEAKSMICLAMSYAPDSSLLLSPDGHDIAAYALGKDYHDIMKQRLNALARRLELDVYRVFCDTAPVLERYWAQQAGLGWIGRNRQLIIPGAGSMFFLGEIFTDAEFDSYDSPMQSRCGSCHRCMDSCPTKALGEDGLDARLCLSYQTIENRGDIPPRLAAMMGNCIYGCDRCTKACPHNHNVPPTTVNEFLPSAALRAMTRDDWRALTVEQYRALFKGSAVKRAKYDGLMRNISKIK
ncbi:MAG: tRNA epoxyqueuosine(34) reductase QueG [Prevotellaceae bacterium]|nr:tRNA epoxyqueuosine(34) reductase QueG [Prevotellaceae bacterium]